MSFYDCIVLYIWRKDKADGIIICQIARRNKAQLISYVWRKDKAGGVRRGFLRFVLAICRLGRVLWHAVKATICTSPTNIADKKQSSLTLTNATSAWYVTCMLKIRIKRIYVDYSHQQALWKGFSSPFSRQTLLTISWYILKATGKEYCSVQMQLVHDLLHAYWKS